MMKPDISARAGVLLALCLLALCASCAAQDYLFSIPEMTFAVTVNPDASVELFYDILFECAPGAHPIDFVDVGLPDRDYDISNMEAAVIDASGRKYDCTGIETSDYIPIGVAVPLGAGTIQPGQRGTFLFRCTMPNRVYQDTTRPDYASLKITPTWFGSQYVQGTTKLGIMVYLPKDIKPEEILHQGLNFTSKAVTDTKTLAAWFMPAARIDGPNMVALSFPKRGMSRVVTMSKWDLLIKWWKDNPNTRFVWGVILAILFGIMFFRASQGTGISCFLGLLLIFGWFFIVNPVAQLVAIPILPVLWFLSERSLKRRRGKYLPAIASVEGGGVKRGLTAPEAAVILERPLNEVLTLVLFGLLKKGICEQVRADPLVLKVNEAFVKETRGERRKAAGLSGKVIHGYEQPFIEALIAAGEVPVAKIKFAKAMKELIDGTVKRMQGFDLAKTRSYYTYIISKAWAEAKSIGDVEDRTKHTDDNLEWLMVSPTYRDDFGYWHSHGYHYHPPWSRGTVFGDSGAGQVSLPTPDTSRTSFGDVAASFAGWSENVAGGLAAQMDPVRIGLDAHGVVDLSGVDKVTLEVLEGMSKASGSGGGGGGGCACACAGCACACACAGGGR
ncbi:MAG: hypothetical protein QM473_03180 [Acidobacteriota bacterium]|nr:hypothetical protein [Acidobacteriota bacterium]